MRKTANPSRAKFKNSGVATRHVRMATPLVSIARNAAGLIAKERALLLAQDVRQRLAQGGSEALVSKAHAHAGGD